MVDEQKNLVSLSELSGRLGEAIDELPDDRYFDVVHRLLIDLMHLYVGEMSAHVRDLVARTLSAPFSDEAGELYGELDAAVENVWPQNRGVRIFYSVIGRFVYDYEELGRRRQAPQFIPTAISPLPANIHPGTDLRNLVPKDSPLAKLTLSYLMELGK